MSTNVAIVGPMGSGKTAYVQRLSSGYFQQGFCHSSEIEMTTVEKCGVTFKLHDIPAFHETSIDYRNYDAIIAVLDASAGVEENLAIVQNLPMRSIIVVNKTDLHTPRAAKLQRVTGRKVFPMSARNGTGLLEPLEAVIATKM